MSVTGRFLPCEECGAWGDDGLLCPGCGTVQGADRVPLDQTAGDGGRRIVVLEGAPGRVLDELRGLAERVRALGDPSPGGTVGASDAAARLDGARELVRLLSQRGHLSGEPLRLVLDLRSALAGERVSVRRQGHHQDRFYRLPWLVLSEGAATLAQVVRLAHLRRQRSFAAGQLVSADEAAVLDELALTANGRVVRLPVSSLTDLPRLELEAWGGAPTPRPLPRTAPGAPLPGAWPSLLGLSAAVAGVLLVAWAVQLIARPAPPPAWPEAWRRLTWGPAPELVEQLRQRGQAGSDLLYRAANDPAPWARRNALVAADALPPLAGRRLIHRLARQDPELTVRLAALDQLARADDLDARSLLLELHQDPEQPLDVRLQALRGICDQGAPEAVAVAVAGLLQPGSPEELRLAWLAALGGRPSSESSGRVSGALLAALADPSPEVRALAAARLAVEPRTGLTAPVRERLLLRAAERTLADPAASDLARTRHVRALIHVGADRAVLQPFALLDLPPAARRALGRALAR